MRSADMLAITLFIIGAILAYHDVSGWGWFVFIGFLACGGCDCGKRQ